MTAVVHQKHALDNDNYSLIVSQRLSVVGSLTSPEVGRAVARSNSVCVCADMHLNATNAIFLANRCQAEILNNNSLVLLRKQSRCRTPFADVRVCSYSAELTKRFGQTFDLSGRTAYAALLT